MRDDEVQERQGGDTVIGDIPSPEAAENIVEEACKLGAEHAEAIVFADEHSTTRFNNEIHQNISAKKFGMYVTVVVDRRKLGSVSLSTNKSHEVEEGLKRAIRIARLTPVDPNFESLPEPTKVHPVPNLYYPETFEMMPLEKAEVISGIVASGLDHDGRVKSVAGYFVNGRRIVALSNSLGIDLSYSFSMSDIQVSVHSEENGSIGSGYSSRTSRDVSEIDFESLATKAIKNSLGGLGPQIIQPGDYEVVLKPLAVAVLLQSMGDSFSAETYREGRSFLSGSLGERLFDEKLTLIDDGRDEASLTAMPFDGEGVPKRELRLIDRGIAGSLCYDTYHSRIDGRESTGHCPHKIERMDGSIFKSPIPTNQIVVPGGSDEDELISDMGRGLLVTRLHYVTVVDKKRAVLSGMTRDGTWYVEGGEIRYPVRNLRFTDSMLRVLSGIGAVGDASTVEMRLREHTGLLSSLTVPSFRLESFRFTGLTA
jgi:predicted Zn-dependent protease